MDISMNSIDNLTLTYFLNKTHYESIINKRNGVEKDVGFSKDKQFYKKRILDLNKKLFRNEINDKQLNSHFNNFVKSCISYLRMVDTTEILQKQYEYMDANIELNSNIELNGNNSSNINPDLANTDDTTGDIIDTYDTSGTKHIKNMTIDFSVSIDETGINTTSDDQDIPKSVDETNNMNSDYLLKKPSSMKKINLDTFVVKTSDNTKPKILPKKQDVNIGTKAFKTKGIAKKKNITNIYEDNK